MRSHRNLWPGESLLAEPPDAPGIGEPTPVTLITTCTGEVGPLLAMVKFSDLDGADTRLVAASQNKCSEAVHRRRTLSVVASNSVVAGSDRDARGEQGGGDEAQDAD